jgi:hypothetical protein
VAREEKLSLISCIILTKKPFQRSSWGWMDSVVCRGVHSTDTSETVARSTIIIEDDLEPRCLNRLRVFMDCKVSSLMVAVLAAGTFIFSSLASSRSLTPLLLLEEVTAFCLDLRHDDPRLMRRVGSLGSLIRVMVIV